MRIACIGGGTGLFTVLSGLKRYDDLELSAIVSMADSGGSTGRLRTEFGTLPPGDVRQCLVALSDAPEDLLRLMNVRFESNGPISGHSLGNLMLTGAKIAQGGEYEGIRTMERILHVRGHVYPVTLDDCQLVARLEDGAIIKGETNIDVPKHNPDLRIEELWLEPEAHLFARAEGAIASADAIILGPGDLYTSVLPNLAIKEMRGTIARSQAAGSKVLYVMNTMTKHGETDGYAASDFVRTIESALGETRLDRIIVNDGPIPESQREAYALERAYPIDNDLHEGRAITADLVSHGRFARHDPIKLAQTIRAALNL